MTVNTPLNFKSPQFVLEIIALVAVNTMAIISGEYSLAVGIDCVVLGVHVGTS